MKKGNQFYQISLIYSKISITKLNNNTTKLKIMEEKITAYLQGDLSGEALSNFENALEKDAALRAAVQRQKASWENILTEGVQYYGELQSIINNIHEEMDLDALRDEYEKKISNLN